MATHHEVEDFILKSGVDDTAAQALRHASPGIQKAVLERGEISNARNPSSAMMTRIREAKSLNFFGAGGLVLTGNTDVDVEEFLRKNHVDDRAAASLRAASTEVQKAVLVRGDLSSARNPSSAVLARIKDAQANVTPEPAAAPEAASGLLGGLAGLLGGGLSQDMLQGLTLAGLTGCGAALQIYPQTLNLDHLLQGIPGLSPGLTLGTSLLQTMPGLSLQGMVGLPGLTGLTGIPGLAGLPAGLQQAFQQAGALPAGIPATALPAGIPATALPAGIPATALQQPGVLPAGIPAIALQPAGALQQAGAVQPAGTLPAGIPATALQGLPAGIPATALQGLPAGIPATALQGLPAGIPATALQGLPAGLPGLAGLSGLATPGLAGLAGLPTAVPADAQALAASTYAAYYASALAQFAAAPAYLQALAAVAGAQDDADDEPDEPPAKAPRAYVKLRGLPFSASREDIMRFFEGFRLSHEQITLGKNHDGRPSGEAFVEFNSEHTAQEAIRRKDRQRMEHRYIEVFLASPYDIQKALGRGILVGDGAGKGSSNRFVPY